eukprot:sb/3471281/
MEDGAPGKPGIQVLNAAGSENSPRPQALIAAIRNRLGKKEDKVFKNTSPDVRESSCQTAPTGTRTLTTQTCPPTATRTSTTQTSPPVATRTLKTQTCPPPMPPPIPPRNPARIPPRIPIKIPSIPPPRSKPDYMEQLEKLLKPIEMPVFEPAPPIDDLMAMLPPLPPPVVFPKLKIVPEIYASGTTV